MNTTKIFLSLIISVLFTCVVYSQNIYTEINVNFRVNSSVIEPEFSTNTDNIQKIIDFISEAQKDNTLRITEISFRGASSPEGSDQTNRKLAQKRLNALENFVRSQVEIPDSIITRNDSYIPWEYLKSHIANSDINLKNEVLSILNEKPILVNYHQPNTHVDNRIIKLKQLDNGNVWQQISKLFFMSMRNAYVVFVTQRITKDTLPPQQDSKLNTIPPVTGPIVQVAENNPKTISRVFRETQPSNIPNMWTRGLHLKTNAIGWGMGISNIAMEIDLAKHFSFTLPIYFSGWNYFKSTIKLRTFAIQPEFRYWLKENNNGFFTGAHFGLMYYNLALNGLYRFQDHNRETPNIGGGLSVGYRLPISKNNRWRIEFSLGVGVYRLYYDKFHNTPDSKDGMLIESVKRTFWSLDQAAISFSYSFKLKKKGGER